MECKVVNNKDEVKQITISTMANYDMVNATISKALFSTPDVTFDKIYHGIKKFPLKEAVEEYAKGSLSDVKQVASNIYPIMFENGHLYPLLFSVPVQVNNGKVRMISSINIDLFE